MTWGNYSHQGEIYQFTPGFVEAGAEANPKIGSSR